MSDERRLLRNLRRRVNEARNFPVNTCEASRHLHTIAEALASRRPYSMLEEEPEYCAHTMLSVLESLWKLRTKHPMTPDAMQKAERRAAKQMKAALDKLKETT